MNKQTILLIITFVSVLAICGAVAAEDPGACDLGTATVSSDTSSGDTSSDDVSTGDLGTTSDSPSLETEDPSTTGDISTTTSSSNSDSTITNDDSTMSNTDSIATDTISTINSSETTNDPAVSDTSQGASEPRVWHVYVGQSVQEAIDNAQPGDTVIIHEGTYTEHIVVTVPVNLRYAEGENVSLGDPEYHVGTGPGMYATIQDAIDAVPGSGSLQDIIIVHTGTYTNQVTVNKTVVIQSAGDGLVTLDGTSITGSIITINPGVTVNISNLTIQNGHASFGGGIYNFGVLIVTDSTFTHNTANEDGGAIYNEGTLTVNDCTFTGNTATSDGGAIDNNILSTLTVNDCTFTGNTAGTWGGAIYNNSYQSTLIVNDSIFTCNNATYGGAIANMDASTITGCTFTGNTAEIGGAIYNWGTFLTVENSDFTSNSATGLFPTSGGAIMNYSSILTVKNSDFTGNTADYGGAIMNYLTSTLTIEYNDFTGNTAEIGGAVYLFLGNAEVHFNRIVGNSNCDIYNDCGSLDATLNWWGTNFKGADPITAGRAYDAVVDPWTILTITANPTTINNRGTSTITADLLHDNGGGYHNPTDGHIPDGIPVTFNTPNTPTLGIINPATANTTDGKAETTFIAISPGSATIQATVDSQTVQTTVNIQKNPTTTPSPGFASLSIISTDPGNNAIGVPLDVIIIVTYNQPISQGPEYNQITLKDNNGNIIPITTTIDNNQLIIKPQPPLKPNTKYTLTIPENAVKNKYGNGLPGPYALTFKTA